MKSFFSAARRYVSSNRPAVSPWYIDTIEVANDWAGGLHIAFLEPPESQDYWRHDTAMIDKYNTRISAGGSMTIRLRLRDKKQNRISRSDVSYIAVNVFETLDPSQMVPGYSNQSVPTTAIFTSYEEDENGTKYNFEHNPYHDSKPMFPKRNTTYTVEVVVYDTAGVPFARQIRIDAV